MTSKVIGYLVLLLPVSVFSQVNNDDCISSLFIRDIDNYCSSPGEFTNVNANESVRLEGTCWADGDQESDVWYSFAPSQPGVFIQLFGESTNTIETIDNMAIAIYQGNCSNLDELTCTNVTNGLPDVIERTLTDLVIGRVYYLRVSSTIASSGTFQLCIDQFKPVKSPESDCGSSVVLL